MKISSSDRVTIIEDNTVDVRKYIHSIERYIEANPDCDAEIFLEHLMADMKYDLHRCSTIN